MVNTKERQVNRSSKSATKNVGAIGKEVDAYQDIPFPTGDQLSGAALYEFASLVAKGARERQRATDMRRIHELLTRNSELLLENRSLKKAAQVEVVVPNNTTVSVRYQ